MREDLPKPEAAAGPDELAELAEFMRRNRVAIIVSCAVVLLATAVAFLYRQRKLHSLERASQMLASARTARDVQAVIDLYGNTPYAPLAVLRLAKMEFNAGDYAGAMKRYDDFIGRFPAHPMASAAELGRVFCAEAMGRLEDARRGYAEFAAVHTNHFLHAHAVFGNARCLEQMGRYGEARTVYEDFIAANPNSPATARAEERLRAVKRSIEKISAQTQGQQNSLQGSSPDLPEPPSPLPNFAP